MKKVIISLFIGFFILINASAADYNGTAIATCACCGAIGQAYYVKDDNGGTILDIKWSCSCILPIDGKCGKCTKHCTCVKECTFVTKCSKKHCNILVCSDCGRHKNDATCGGDCINDQYCSHCREPWCSICNNHICKHNKSGYCSKPHCTSRYYCSKCGHICSGEHQYGTLICPEAHCNDFICTVAGCNEHKNVICGGGHTKGSWVEENGVHNRYCGRTDLGCTTVVDTHAIVWGTPDKTHVSTCMRGCGLTYTHTPKWGEYYKDGDKHTRYCTVVVGDTTCQATDSHMASWSGYVKSDNGGEESGASHLRRCTVTGCKLTSDEHVWSNDVKWRMVDEEKHKRVCPTCELVQVLGHDFVERVAIADDIEKHYKVCALCLDAEDNKYRLHETHVDEETNGRGNGICDLCNKELWRVTKSTTELTNEDVTVKVEMFSDHDDRIKLPKKMIDEYGNEFFEESGEYTIEENGQYIFSFEYPDRDVVVDIDNINYSIYGRVFITPGTATTGSVTLKLVTSTEGFNKTIDVAFEDEPWHENTLELEREVSSNGRYVFYAKDSLGNDATFVANVNNIVSGFGSVTTTFDVFQNGYIFTDILVNVNQAWILDDALVNCLEGSIYKYKVDGSGLKTAVNFNKVQISDALGNKVTDKILSSGAYYLRVAIGGANVFDDVGTYMVEVRDVTVKNGDSTLVTLSGKNRIEVVVQSLNDLT